MENILRNLIDSGNLDEYLNDFDKNNLKDIVKNINKYALYPSLFHGLHHSQKVLLFAYLLGKKYNLDEIDMKILIDAAIYHDIGRINEFNDSFHGLAATYKISLYAKDEIYKDEENMNILKAIIDAHSQDGRLDDIALDYDIQNINRFKLLAKLLKDADALDRARFRKTSTAALRENYLNTDYSKTLISLSEYVNQYFRLYKSSYFYDKYKDEFKGDANITCKHGIGNNFFILKSILENGILSNYAKVVNDLDSSRRFFGSNSELWISVVAGDGEAKSQFIDNGISFDVSVPKYIEGVKSKSEALDKGLPIDNLKYTDERFVFYEIPKENINKINVPNLDESLDKLNYLVGSGNIDVITRVVFEYLDNLKTMCGYTPNQEEMLNLLRDYKTKVLSFESLSIQDQQTTYKDFLRDCDLLMFKINAILQNWMNEGFKKKFNKEKVTVCDLVTYILDLEQIEYKQEGNTFVLNQKIR